jgi:hypothetical protein
MLKQTLFFIGTLLFLSIGAYGLYTFIVKEEQTESFTYSQTQNEEYSANTSQNAKQQSTGQLQVQGAINNQNTESGNLLPTPKQFTVYEKYANEQSSLF